MPQVIVAVIAAVAATAIAAAPAVVAALGVVGAAVLGAVVGMVITYAGNALIAGMSGKPKAADPINAADDARRTVRSAIEPRRIVYGRARVSGPLIYASSYGPNKEYLNMVVPVADHEIEAIDAVWVGDTRVAASEIDANGAVIAGKFGLSYTESLSPPAGATLAERVTFFRSSYAVSTGNPYLTLRRWLGTQTTADPQLVAASQDGWTEQDALTGVAYIYARARYQPDLFSAGIPGLSAEVRGRKVYDPRTGVAAYSDNWALCILDYLRADFGLSCSDDEIDFDSFIAAANLSDEAVQIATDSSATQKRYTLNGTFTLDREPIAVLEEMVAAGGGALVYVAGKYRLYGGAYQTPSVTLTESDFASAIEVVTKPPRREAFNGVRGTYINPDAYWQASEFAPVQSAAYIAEDGEEVWADLNLPWVINQTRAQRLAKQLLLRSRQGVTVRAAVKYARLDLAVWQTVAITLADLGWSAKPFRIISWTFDPQSGLITLTMQEEQVASYAWTYDEAASAPEFPDTSLIDPFQTPAPAGLAVTEELYATRDGAGVRTRAILTWAPPPTPFVTGYDVEFKAASEAVWRSAAATVETRGEVLDLAAGAYDFRVRARTLTVPGEWAEVRASIGGLAAQPPAAVTGLSLQSIGGLAYLRWDRSTELDVRIGGRYEIRHNPETAGATWAGATTIGEAVTGEANFALVPLKAGTYFIRAVDAGGVYGPAADIDATQATALAFANVTTLDEHSGFSGSKSGTVVISSTLRLDSSGLVDSEADFDAIAEIDRTGTILASGAYDFSGGIDLTTVKPVRLTSRIVSIVEDEDDEFDDRIEPIDTWTTVDGVFGGEADAWVECRQTDDDPAGSPTWSAWRRLDSAEFKARGFEFRAQLRSYDAAFNIHVSELSVTADEVA